MKCACYFDFCRLCPRGETKTAAGCSRRLRIGSDKSAKARLGPPAGVCALEDLRKKSDYWAILMSSILESKTRRLAIRIYSIRVKIQNWFSIFSRRSLVPNDDFELVRPLASSNHFQAFYANKENQSFRLVRFLKSGMDSFESIRRATLVSHPNVLPCSIVDDADDVLVTATPFLHAQHWDNRPALASELPRILFTAAAAIAASHRFGIAHGHLVPSRIYWSGTNPLAPTTRMVSCSIDLLDGALHDSDADSRIGTQSLARDVYAFGTLIQDQWVRLSSMNNWGIFKSLVADMHLSDWNDRPTMEEVVERLNECISQLPGDSSEFLPNRSIDFHGSLDLSSISRNDASPSDATQEISAVALESVAKQRMIPLHMPEIGRFAIERSLGEGGMGSVFLGRDRSNEELVAIKVLSERMSKNDLASRRFAKEARLMSTIDHPAIARLIEFNRAGETMYLAMEYVPGGSLVDFTRTLQPLNESLVIAAIADAARGLNVAHQLGMVHRDIKPANLLLSARGERSFQIGELDTTNSEPLIKVADFGLAKNIDSAESMAMTQTGMIMGTPYYMAPEQCRGLEVGPATDVYALGVTLFQCLTGKLPYDAQSPVEIFRMHCDAAIPKLRSIIGTASEAIQSVVEKCLAKNPNSRYQNAGELLLDLEGLLTGNRTSILLHPAVPDANAKGLLQYQFQWRLRSSAESLWPYVSNTDRVNQAVGLPAVQYKTIQDPKMGMRRMATVRAMGMTMEWEEHPFEWIEGRRLSVLRQFPAGPFYWFTNVVELHPQSDGGALVVQTLQMVPRNFLGKLFAKFQIGNKSERNFGRVYEKIDEYLQSQSRSTVSNAFTASKTITREQRRRLNERFVRIRSIDNTIDPKVLDTLEQYLEFASDLDVARLRPLAFAERFGLKSDEVVEACLLAAREGALILLWDILCPTCRIPSDVKETLKGLADHGHCEACNADYELDFAKSIELIFRAHPEVRAAETRTYCVGGPAFSSHVVAQVRLQADERLNVQLCMNDGQYRLRGPQLPYVVDFRVAPSGQVGRWDVDLARPVAKQDIPTLRSGEQVLSLFNSNADPRQVRIERLASRADALTAADAARLPAFREWFPDEVLSPGQMVSLTTVTLLGCQIASAAELYSALSDQAACSHILKHLQNMANIVSANSGCVIKTMNDGLNTVFPNTSHAIAAATQISKLSLEWDVSIRQAIHQGSAIVATINDRLDYFGETPQYLEELLHRSLPNELWMSDRSWNDENIGSALEQHWSVQMELPLPNWPKWNIMRATREPISQPDFPSLTREGGSSEAGIPPA